MIEWSERFATNNARIDQQHRTLFEIFNDFERAIDTGRAAVRLETTLKLLGSYIRSHFRYEEKCMHEARCPVAAENREAHAEFELAYRKFASRFETEGYTDELAQELLSTAERWLVGHIGRIDVQLRHCGPDPSRAGGRGSDEASDP